MRERVCDIQYLIKYTELNNNAAGRISINDYCLFIYLIPGTNRLRVVTLSLTPSIEINCEGKKKWLNIGLDLLSILFHSVDP